MVGGASPPPVTISRVLDAWSEYRADKGSGETGDNVLQVGKGEGRVLGHAVKREGREWSEW